MKSHRIHLIFLLGLTALGMLVLSQCAGLRPGAEEDSVVYALGSRSDFASPLNRQMKPVATALEFSMNQFRVTAAHDRVLLGLIKKDKAKYLLAGYSRPGLPPEYARVLSEKRTHSVRHRLIELGMEPAQIQTAGFGNDFPRNGPTTDVVVVYEVAD
jgi:outer membrane protein OmpA-like peptidoglycan-associated protein